MLDLDALVTLDRALSGTAPDRPAASAPAPSPRCPHMAGTAGK